MPSNGRVTTLLSIQMCDCQLRVRLISISSLGTNKPTEEQIPQAKILRSRQQVAFRQMARGAAKLFGSPDECTALRQWYVSANEAQKLSITPILNKLACSAESMSGAFAPPPQATAPVEKNEKAVSPVSAFAALGWFLFIITLILKLHYFVSYRKHKKLAEKYRKE